VRSWRSALLAFLVGCSGGSDTATPAVGACDDVPRLSWESHGQAIITEYCQPCHASGSELRNGAPENVTFDSYEETLAWRDRILATATVSEPTMPPNLDLSAIDAENLQIWLTCWED
jgi:uncharacterized membrane protein